MAVSKYLKLTKNNKHLLDVFSDDCYLELGSITNPMMNKVLKKKLVRYSDLTYFDIQASGIGSSNISHEELSKKIPFMYFENLNHKNPARQLFLTHGVYVQKRAGKELFTPIILIPINLYYKDNEIWVQMLDSPLENPYLPSNKKNIDLIDKAAYHLDEYCMSVFRQDHQNLRFENYLTFGEISLIDQVFYNDRFKLEDINLNDIYNGFDIEDDNRVCNISTLNRLQRTALEQAHFGNSFALTGALGTGKTTTLANIAADAIYAGKRVLYVSNNTETLKEVKELFEKHELNYLLSDFSNPFDANVDDKSVEQKEMINDNTIRVELQTKYDGIREYTKMLYDKINDYYFIDVMKGLIEFNSVTERFSDEDIKGVDKLYRLEINNIYNALKVIDKELDKIESYRGSKFNNIPIRNTVGLNDIFDLLKQMYDSYNELTKQKKVLEDKYGFSNIPNYAYLRNVISNYHNLDKNLIPASWLVYEKKDKNSKKLVNYQEAKILFDAFSKEMSEEKEKLMLLDSDYNINLLNDINIHYSLALIQSRFKDKSINEINHFLKNNNILCERLLKLKDTLNECEYNFGKMRDKIGIKVNYKDSETIEELVPMILYFGTHKIPKIWLDETKVDAVKQKIISLESQLKEYEDLVVLYNKYFNDVSNVGNNLIFLKKKSEKSDKYQNENINFLIKKISKLKDLYERFDSLNDEYYSVTLHNFDKNVSVLDEYNNFVSLVSAIKNDDVRKKVIKNLNSLKGIALEEFIKPFIIFSTTYLEIKKGYESLKEFDLVKDEILLPRISTEVLSACEYCLSVREIQNKMGLILKREVTYVQYEEYILLANKIKDLETIRKKINGNEQYAFLFGDLFKGYETDVEGLDKFILNFAFYTNIFKDNESMKASLNDEKFKKISNILNNCFNVCEDISGLLKDYPKIFNDNVGKYYYDNLNTLIVFLKDLIESNDELEVYLNINKAMQVLLNYKLFNFNELIINNDKGKFADKFMYSFYHHLYDEYVNVNPGIVNSEGYAKLLEEIMLSEKKIFSSNVEKLKILRPKKNMLASYMKRGFMNYLEKVADYKYLVLSNSQIVNLYLDIEYFDLVLIDDANLLNAEHYYKALNGKQVILAGLNDVNVSIKKDIISRIKKADIIELKKRYVTTPLVLLKNITRSFGVFYNNDKDNDGLEIENRNFGDIVCDLLLVKNSNGEYCINRSVKINYFVRSLKKIRRLYDDIANALCDKVKLEDIFYCFIKQINISDLYHPYIWNSDYNIIDLGDYANEMDVYKINNLINALMCTKKKLIVMDENDLLSKEEKEGFLEVISSLDKKRNLMSNVGDSVCKMVSSSLNDKKLKVLGKYHNYDLVIQKKKKNYGLIIFNAPTNYGEDILNVYRDYYNSDYKCSIVFLNDLVEKYDETIERIVGDSSDEN